VKLQGSLIFASGGTVTAGNVYDGAANHNGKITFISNMEPSQITPHAPGLLPLTASPVFGTTTNNPVLTGTTVFDADPTHPNIGQLITGAGTQGILKSGFWNEGSVTYTGTSPVKITRLTQGTTNNPFNGYDQIFVKNVSSFPATGVRLRVGTNPYVLIPTSPAGRLLPGEVFTTTVATGELTSVSISFNGPLDTSTTCDGTATFELTDLIGADPVTFLWEEDSGSGFAPLSSETNQSLVLNNVPYSHDGYKYRCIVTDAYGTVTSLAATLTVMDVALPTPSCAAITITLDATGNYTLTSTDIDAIGGSSTDDCGIASLSVAPSAYGCLNVGENTATLTVTDLAGKTAQCTTTVTVQDLTPPAVVCNDIEVALNSSGTYTLTEANINAIAAGSSDACGIKSKTVSPDTFDCEDKGENTVTLTVTDTNDLSSQCEATVTVIDNLPPTAVCNDITITMVNEVYSLTASDIDGIAAGSTDNCGIVSKTFSFEAVDCDPANNTGTLTLTDGSGNSSTCTATVHATLAISDPSPLAQQKYFFENCAFQVKGCGGTGIADYAFTWYYDVDGAGPQAAQMLSNGAHPRDSLATVNIVTAGRICTLNLNGLGFNAEGSYYCVLNDTVSNVQTAYGTLAVRNHLNIIQDPQPTTKNELETAQFTVVTNARGGIEPLHYVWKWYHGGSWLTVNNGNHVSGSGSQVTGADTDTLSIALSDNGVQDAGKYKVVVSDSRTPTPETDTSLDALLTVTIHMHGSMPGVIRAYTNEPLSITATIGNGVPPYRYTWRKGGVDMGAPSQAILDLGTADSGDIGSYDVVVDDDPAHPENPPITVGPCQVSVADKPALVNDLADVYVYENTPVTLSVSISGGFLPLVYTWNENGAPLGGPNAPTLDLGAVTLIDSGRMFDVSAVDQGSTLSGPTPLDSKEITLYVGTPVTFLGHSDDVRVYNDEAPFPVDATFEGGLFLDNYEWLRRPFGGSTETSLGVFTDFTSNTVALAVDPAGQLGVYDYRVCIEDAVTTACTGTGQVEFAGHVQFDKPLEDTTVPKHQPFRWEVSATGGLTPLSYGWSKDEPTKDWQDLHLFTPYMDIADPDDSSAGLYRVEVTESDSSFTPGQTIYSEAVLTIGFDVPLLNMAGLAMLTALAGGLGVLRIRRRK